MSRALYYLLSPGGPVVVFAACAVWIVMRRRSAAARRITLLASIFYLAAATYVVPATIADRWSGNLARFNDSSAGGPGSAMVLLGAGNEPIRGWSTETELPNRTEAARVLEALRVFALASPQWVISSGGGEPSDAFSQSSAIVMRNALVRSGVPASRILLESESHDTHAEAVLIAPMLVAHHIARVILVTSAVHMPRSLGTFRAVGIDAIPAPAPDPGRLLSARERWRPSERGLTFSSELAHELAGIPYYWVRGWWRR